MEDQHIPCKFCIEETMIVFVIEEVGGQRVIRQCKTCKMLQP